MTDYVLITRHIIQVTIGNVSKTYDQKKKGKRLSRSLAAFMFCRKQGWPVEHGEKWSVFEANDPSKLSELCELMEWFDQ